MILNFSAVVFFSTKFSFDDYSYESFEAILVFSHSNLFYKCYLYSRMVSTQRLDNNYDCTLQHHKIISDELQINRKQRRMRKLK